MKYIRTEDGRLLKVRLEYHELPAIEYTIVYWTEIGEPFINRQDNFKLSDTIEELCDEFVCVEKNGKDHNFLDIEQAKKSLDEYIVYGAIWTDKGLIYAAKTNDKGELELL